MHETSKTILKALPGTVKEVAQKTGLTENNVGKRLRFLLLLKRVTTLGKRKHKPTDIKSSTVYGELDDGNAWLNSDNWFGKK